jgi:hypothetical protein
MNNKKIITSIPIEFDKQDEGHGSHNPLTWKVITTYYAGRGVYPFKRYNNKVLTTNNPPASNDTLSTTSKVYRVLTCAFEGKQTEDDELVKEHFRAKKEKQYGVFIRNLK